MLMIILRMMLISVTSVDEDDHGGDVKNDINL